MIKASFDKGNTAFLYLIPQSSLKTTRGQNPGTSAEITEKVVESATLA